MNTLFKKYLHTKGNFTEEELDRIAEVTVAKKLKKSQFLLKEGDIWQFHTFVPQGSLRKYKTDENGKPLRVEFSEDNYWVGSNDCLVYGKPAQFNIEAVEDSVILMIDNKNFEKLRNTIPEFAKMVSEIYRRSLGATNWHLQSAIGYSAEKTACTEVELTSFVRRKREFPKSFLGITPERIDRFRSQIFTILNYELG